MKPLKLALLITCALLLNETATATLTKPDASKTVHESECPCLLCWWCDPEEPHEPPPHEEPHIPPPHEEPHIPPPHEEPHDHLIPEIPELPPLPELPPIPKFCPPSEEEPEIPHYPQLAPPPPHVYMYQPNPIIAAASASSAAMRKYMPVPSTFATFVAAVGYLFG
jgi:hypothetical protein